MRFPSIGAFKKSMGGRKGFVIYLSTPKGEKVHEMIIEGPLNDEQHTRLETLVLDILKENSERHKPGDPISYTTTER